MRLSRAELRAHLTDELLPLWERHGLDRARGGYWNRLGTELRPTPDGFKRLLVHTRQIYAFSRAAELGAGDWARVAANHGLEFLVGHFWDSRSGGWFTTTSDAGEPLDRRKDLYGHAFAIFALAEHHRIAHEPESLRLALETLALVRERLADKKHGGYFEGASEDWRPVDEPRRQNPHMHLVEALLALHAAAPGERGQLVEPGHGFEWYALLRRAVELGAHPRLIPLAERLRGFAERHGVDRDGGVFDEIARSGAPRATDQRLWPQTERLKALASRLRRFPDPVARKELEAALLRCAARYLDPATRGWREQLARDGRVLSTAQNATSVYHVVAAFGELLGVAD